MSLFAALSLPLLVVFYLFRPQPRVKKTSSYFLWQRAVPDSQGGTFARRLQSNPLMWLQLLFLALLVFFLCRPSVPWVSKVPSQKKVVLVIDRSASMASGDSFERALELADEAIEAMLSFRLTGSRPEIMLIACDSEVEVLVPFTDEEAPLKQALGDLQVTDKADKLEELRPFLLSLVKAHQAKIWLLSDHLPKELEIGGLQFQSAAQKSDNNVGVVSFSVTPPDLSRDQEKPFLFIRLENFSTTAQQRLLRLEKLDSDNPDRALATVLEKTVHLAANSGQTITDSVSASRFELKGSTLFRVSLLPFGNQEPDALSTDDTSYCVVPPFRHEKVLVGIAPGLKAGFLLRAIAATSGIKVVKVRELLQQAEPATLDLLLWPVSKKRPKKLKTRSLFLLAGKPQGDDSVVEKLKQTEKTSPLVDDCGVEWTRQRVEITDRSPLEPGEVVLLESESGPALSLGGLSQSLPTLHWRFPLSHSSLPLSPGLPVIVGRFINEYSRNQGVPIAGSLPTAAITNRPVGASWAGKLKLVPAAGRAANLGSERRIPIEASTFESPEYSGIYWLQNEEEDSQAVAVNLFSYDESSLPQSLQDANFEAEGAEPAAKQEMSEQVQFREVGYPILLLALLLLLLETAVFLKRGRP